MSTPLKTIPIHETFYTFQGEGVHMGRPAFFIRTFGCPVQCPWCDSAGTWHPEYIPKGIARMTGEQLVQEVKDCGAPIVVITGGEPTIHDLTYFTKQLRGLKVQIHLETSGGFPIRGTFDWITLSPKRWHPPLAENVAKAHEFKLIIGADPLPDIVYYHGLLLGLGLWQNAQRPIWLHPEWSQRSNPKVLEAISKAVKGNTDDFRAGWQLHKLYAVDLLDSGSRTPVPLGGNPSLGF